VRKLNKVRVEGCSLLLELFCCCGPPFFKVYSEGLKAVIILSQEVKSVDKGN